MSKKGHRVRNIAKTSWFGNSIHYWPTDALALARSMALVETVAVNSEQAGNAIEAIQFLDSLVKNKYPLL